MCEEDTVEQLIGALDSARQGKTSPIEFTPAEAGQAPRWVLREDLPASATALEEQHGERIAAVVRTSGSTGTPKQTLLSAEALAASAQATAERLNGHGQWLLTLQPSYVAGLAVLSRSLIAGTTPVPLLEGTTDPRRFAAAAEAMTAARRYVSLVPTQLSRLLETADAHTLAALRRFDAILLGGGASSPELLDRATNLGLHVIRTYGMSETCGGCVYDGRPLPGVSITTETTYGDDSAAHSEDGTAAPISLSGPMIALGYAEQDLTAARFDHDERGERRFRTDDLGILTREAADSPVLRVTGRADDVIVTGGVKVSAEAVRQGLLADEAVREAFVGPAPDATWGQRVCAAVVLRSGDDLPEQTTARLRAELGTAAIPRQVHVMTALPTLGTGKPDRRRLLQLFAEAPPPSTGA